MSRVLTQILHNRSAGSNTRKGKGSKYIVGKPFYIYISIILTPFRASLSILFIAIYEITILSSRNMRVVICF